MTGIPYKKNRSRLMLDLQRARARYEEQPGDAARRFRYVERLIQAGEFWQAHDIAQPLLQKPTPTQALALAKLESLLGNYAVAQSLLLELIAAQRRSPIARLQSEIALLFTYYQTQQFAKTHDLFQGQAGAPQLPQWELMKAFGDEPPYQIDWGGRTEESLPFLITDPLPIVEIALQGKPIYALIDTGGDTLYLDDQYAEELGIRAVSSVMGTFGGGKQGKIGFARARRLQMGGITLDPVPVTIMPTQRWSKGFAEGRYTIGGVVGTSILKQFLATMDYPAGKLVLRPRTPAARQAFLEEKLPQAAAVIPFAMWMTHHMLAKGSLNEHKGLTYFVDSGLASPAAFAAPRQTLEYAHIPIPETKIDENGIGGGGDGLWASGSFPIHSLGLGPLTKENALGDYGSLTPDTYWQKGFIQDGLISHQFLRDYRWTLDFDQMQYIFIKP